MSRQRRFWGWGYEDDGLTPTEQARLSERVRPLFGDASLVAVDPPRATDIVGRTNWSPTTADRFETTRASIEQGGRGLPSAGVRRFFALPTSATSWFVSA